MIVNWNILRENKLEHFTGEQKEHFTGTHIPKNSQKLKKPPFYAIIEGQQERWYFKMLDTKNDYSDDLLKSMKNASWELQQMTTKFPESASSRLTTYSKYYVVAIQRHIRTINDLIRKEKAGERLNLKYEE